MYPFVTRRPQVNNISAKELQDQLTAGRQVTVIDVREPWEYEEGHIPGSTLLPLGQIPQWSKTLDKDEEIILVCRSGSRSVGAYQYLDRLGFTNLRNMVGGMITWRGSVE
ncbi:MAG: rhodanese-like domain-containing protein [Symbiobacteriia bacterium]